MSDLQSSSWTADTYTASITSRCWWFTPYDDGWHNALKWGGDLQDDAELRAILEIELALPKVPDWAERVCFGSAASACSARGSALACSLNAANPLRASSSSK